MSNLVIEAGRVAPEQRSSFYWALSDSLVLIKRSTRHIVRNFENILLAIVVPVNILLLFRFVFGGAIDTGDVSYINYIVAGVIVQGIAWNATATAVSVSNDVNGGLMYRFRSLPMLNSAVLTGHVVANLLRNLISAIVVILVGLVIGFRPAGSLLDWVAAFGMVMLFGLALSWVSAVFGLLASTPEGATGFTFGITFLPYLSSAFVPTGHMPGVLRFIADNQPITHVTETLRALTLGTPVGSHGLWAVAWCVGILLVSYAVAGALFKRRTSG